MKKRIFWKDIQKSFSSSFGRFLSIMLLLLLGAFALTGLKVTTPDLQRTASHYLSTHKTMDLSVIATAGLSKDDQKELRQIKGATVEFDHFADATIKGTDKAVRIFSNSKKLSTYKLVSGHLPKKSHELALASTQKGNYQIGDTITFTQGKEANLKQTNYKIVGFVNSSEVWSTKNLGSAAAGDGTLTAYAVVNGSAFDSDFYTIARLRYDNLRNLNPFSDTYIKRLNNNQERLDELLEDNGGKRLKVIKAGLQSKVNASRSLLAVSKQQLKQKKAALLYLSGEQLSQAQQTVLKAEAKITENEINIRKAQDKIDGLEKPVYSTYTRSSSPGGQGYSTYESISKNISNIGNIFPVVLYLVAALVTFTTMTRFVNEERNNSGILKSLGYSDSDVMKKFVVYGLIASLTGTILGVIGGHYLLPKIITRNVTTTMTISSPHLYFYWSYTLLAVGLGLLSAVFPAFWVARRELSEKPAQLLLPKPPMRGSKILLEHVGFIWRRLSFTQKVTARNIFRYKQRMFMTVFGVAGSVALLFAGLGIQSSLGKVIDNQFNHLTTYDMLVLKNNTTQSNINEVSQFLKSNTVSNYQEISSQNMDVMISGQKEKKTISILATNKNDFESFIHLKEAKTGKKVILSNEGAVISKKLAAYYGVQKGDLLSFKDENGKKRKIKVSDVVEMNVNHYLFMTNKYYREVFNENPSKNAVLVSLKDGSVKNISNQATKLLAMKGVSAVSQNSSLIKMVNTAVNGLNASMAILVIVSILLAVVILYNLTNINVAERIRELSTIKVLGFHNEEITMYIYKETISLSIFGILLGLIGGDCLHKVIISVMSRDTVYPTAVDWYVFVLPVVVIIVILAVLGWIVNHRLKMVDMLEALKSVD